MIVLLLVGWGSARAMWWEDPFAGQLAGSHSALSAAPPQTTRAAHQGPSASSLAPLLSAVTSASAPLLSPPDVAAAWVRRLAWRGGTSDLSRFAARDAVLSFVPRSDPARATSPAAAPAIDLASAPASAPFLPPPAPPSTPAMAGRWSLDAWGFWRQGSDAALISQGRVPIYGASQTGAVLQYRLAPSSRIDPRLYARAYRALVQRGESEIAAGASLRPLARLPLRVAGELRYTDAALSNSFRPAAYAVTELAPIGLPYGAQLEAYGQAGWVGGPGATAFADGLASVTRNLPRVARLSDNALQLSLGAALWGGAQRDAQRLDVGPTLRADMRIGAVPARLTIDWRERVAGGAAPGGGLAATLSSQF
ncbi:MAG: hypothetical protein ACKO1N_00315 [Erythrobacter sp.]